MRVPAFARYRRYFAGFGLFAAGMIVGSAVYMSIHQKHFSLLYVKMHKYQEENRALKQDVEDLRKFSNKQSIINVVHIYLQNPDNGGNLTEDIQQEIEVAVKKELKLVIGKKAAYVADAHPLYEKLISQKTYQIHEKLYIVEVKSMVLVQTELSVWITAREKRA